jgi:hypothetical protein
MLASNFSSQAGQVMKESFFQTLQIAIPTIVRNLLSNPNFIIPTEGGNLPSMVGVYNFDHTFFYEFIAVANCDDQGSVVPNKLSNSPRWIFLSNGVNQSVNP